MIDKMVAGEAIKRYGLKAIMKKEKGLCKCGHSKLHHFSYNIHKKKTNRLLNGIRRCDVKFCECKKFEEIGGKGK